MQITRENYARQAENSTMSWTVKGLNFALDFSWEEARILLYLSLRICVFPFWRQQDCENHHRFVNFSFKDLSTRGPSVENLVAIKLILERANLIASKPMRPKVSKTRGMNFIPSLSEGFWYFTTFLFSFFSCNSIVRGVRFLSRQVGHNWVGYGYIS